MTKKLSAFEVERLERARVLKELRSKEQVNLQLQFELVSARQKILELSIRLLDLDRHQIADDREKVNVKTATERKEYENDLAAIKKRLKLTGKFGYNPDTYEVITDDQN